MTNINSKSRAKEVKNYPHQKRSRELSMYSAKQNKKRSIIVNTLKFDTVSHSPPHYTSGKCDTNFSITRNTSSKVTQVLTCNQTIRQKPNRTVSQLRRPAQVIDLNNCYDTKQNKNDQVGQEDD